uniref:Recombinase RecA n=1 Tax=Geoglobus ahangari TaxID=113653 RepID=A0A7C3UJY1_9EURY
MILRSGSVPTGIILIDRRLDGGLPKGSLVCVYANPIGMPEAFLYQFASVRKTYYFNTSRPAEYIIKDMRSMGYEADVEFIDIFNQYYLNEYGQCTLGDPYRNKEIFDFVYGQLDRLSQKEEYNVIFDSISFFLKLNIDTSFKECLLNKIYLTAKQTGSLFYIYLLKYTHPPDLVYTVLDLSDVIFDIDVTKIGDRWVNVLSIPKIRGKQPISETFRYYISEGVVIDTARDIA